MLAGYHALSGLCGAGQIFHPFFCQHVFIDYCVGSAEDSAEDRAEDRELDMESGRSDFKYGNRYFLAL